MRNNALVLVRLCVGGRGRLINIMTNLQFKHLPNRGLVSAKGITPTTPHSPD
jgi:hypothetical protein